MKLMRKKYPPIGKLKDKILKHQQIIKAPSAGDIPANETQQTVVNQAALSSILADLVPNTSNDEKLIEDNSTKKETDPELLELNEYSSDNYNKQRIFKESNDNSEIEKSKDTIEEASAPQIQASKIFTKQVAKAYHLKNAVHEPSVPKTSVPLARQVIPAKAVPSNSRVAPAARPQNEPSSEPAIENEFSTTPRNSRAVISFFINEFS